MTDYLRDRVTVAVGERYLIEDEIGRGGMAVVYRAVDLRLHRPAAIKVLPPELAFSGDVRARFVREAQTAAQLAHPNIVPIYSVDEHDGIVYFAMALVEGDSVAGLLTKRGSFGVDDTVRVLRDVADALAYAHERGVVHRDIKPDNILIERSSGRAVVTDFGIARAAMSDTRITATGVAVGTPAYMSPEQAIGEREIDGRSDIYSLGVVGYQMLAGEPPFRATNTPAMLVKHVSERPRPIRERRPDTPAYLAVIVDRALAKRPEDRWQDAGELRDALANKSGGRYTPHPAAQNPAERWPLAAPDAAAPAVGDYRAEVRAFGTRLRQQIEADVHERIADRLARFTELSERRDQPGGLSRREFREWKKTRRKLLRAGFTRMSPAEYDERPLEERVLAFRRSVVRALGVGFGAFLLNVAVFRGPPWVFFVWAFLGFDVLRKAGSIWSDGIGPLEAFKKGIRSKLRAQQPPLPSAAGALQIAPPRHDLRAVPPGPDITLPPEVASGAYGDAVRRASADARTIRDVVSGLRPVEREMIPEVMPTVDALAARVVSIATTLHRLDADVSGTSLGALDSRIASLRTEQDTPDRDRRLSLLQRQRESLHDLLERRRTLANQLESASLALQNLKLDLLKLRSSGLGSALEDVTSATQEARALSRDIAHVVEASDDLRNL